MTAQLLRTKGFKPEHRAMAPYLQGQEPQGREGLAVLAHPARYRRPPKQLIPAAAELGIDGVEAYYAYTNTKPWTPSPISTLDVKQLSLEYGLFATCGTDTHGLNLLYRL